MRRNAITVKPTIKPDRTSFRTGVHRLPNVRQVVLKYLPGLAMVVLLIVWHTFSLRYPPFILPSPYLVAERFFDKIADGTWVYHTATTLSEALAGLVCGSVLAVCFGYGIAKSAWVDRLLSPFIVASQGVPFIAVAPLIFIWFGNGSASKVLLCTLIVFFPILVNVTIGLRNISPLYYDLFRSYNATPTQTLIKLEIPAAAPTIFGGIRIGGTLSVIGAISAEFVSANRGLGFMIQQGNNLYDTALVFVGVITIIALALSLYTLIGFVSSKFTYFSLNQK
jgi:NitT/TauT family transport system permease protein